MTLMCQDCTFPLFVGRTFPVWCDCSTYLCKYCVNQKDSHCSAATEKSVFGQEEGCANSLAQGQQHSLHCSWLPGVVLLNITFPANQAFKHALVATCECPESVPQATQGDSPQAQGGWGG